MTEYITDILNKFLHFISQDESFYVIESILVFFIAFVFDLVQRKILRVFKDKAKHTKNIWDDIFLGALPKPVSFIIWISSISYIADIIQEATGSMIFYKLF